MHLVDSEDKICGRAFIHEIETIQTEVPVELLILSECSVPLGDHFDDAQDLNVHIDNWQCYWIMIISWEDGVASRRGIGTLDRHAINQGYPPGLVWKEVLLGWDPYEGYAGIASNESAITHGTFFWHASREGYISKGTSVHGGLRTKLFVCIHLQRFCSPRDYEIDEYVGFTLIEAQENYEIGMSGIIDKVRKTVKIHRRIFLSILMARCGASFCPDCLIQVSPPQQKLQTTRELKRFIRGLEGINLVGADVVEVSPSYDTIAETTSVAAADLIVNILASMTNIKIFLR
ncbi:Ureohydrolase [Penicillium hetheringtonii]|uniref:Ureohydrolase n=1 Tax=Penicillium hetheringtonii TaxID=911720 RepID=A0AAD6DX01_9EURO|nr:Ureohydrolase [Penicillium hetheringtonii]